MMDQSMEQSLPLSCFRLPSPSSSPYDVGFRFVPTDIELLHYLEDKVFNPTYDPGLIMTTDIYKYEPWFLPWDPADNFLFHGPERYFFVQRKPFSGRDTGTRPRRTIDSEQGWWNSNTDDKPIYDGGGMVMGYVKSLTFFVKDEPKKRKAGDSKNRKQDGIKTDWIMHEYMLEQRKVRQWVLCRIHYNGKPPLSFSPSPQMAWQCSGGPDLLQPPPPALYYSEGPDPMQPSPLILWQCSGGPDQLQPPPQTLYCGGGPDPMQPPPQTLWQCSGGPDMLQPPLQASHCSGGPDGLTQLSPSKRLRSSRVQESESQPLEVQESLVLAGVDGDAEDIASWVDSLICDLV